MGVDTVRAPVGVRVPVGAGVVVEPGVRVPVRVGVVVVVEESRAVPGPVPVRVPVAVMVGLPSRPGSVRAAPRGHGPYPLGLRHLRQKAALQERIAIELHSEVGRAVAAGWSWSDIGRALGVNRETAYRQFLGGNVIVVVRPHQSRSAGS
jgi:hypothetical protein